MFNSMKKALFVFMIFPLWLIMFNNAAYKHYHIMPGGIRIEHAHPFKSCCDSSGSGQNHQHKERELIFYSLITDSSVVLCSFTNLAGVFPQRESDIKFLQPLEFLTNESLSLVQLRAPPPEFS